MHSKTCPEVAGETCIINGHTFMTSTKNDQFCHLLPPLPAKMNNRSIVYKQQNPQARAKFQKPLPLHFHVDVMNV